MFRIFVLKLCRRWNGNYAETIAKGPLFASPGNIDKSWLGVSERNDEENGSMIVRMNDARKKYVEHKRLFILGIPWSFANWNNLNLITMLIFSAENFLLQHYFSKWCVKIIIKFPDKVNCNCIGNKFKVKVNGNDNQNAEMQQIGFEHSNELCLKDIYVFFHHHNHLRLCTVLSPQKRNRMVSPFVPCCLLNHAM